MGSFRLTAGTPHLHGEFNFAELVLETAGKSLRHSCRSELTRQGISLPYNRYSNGLRLPGLQFGACTPPFNLPAPGRRQTLYVVMPDFAEPCVFSKQSPPPGLCPPPPVARERGPLLPKLRG